MPFFSGPTSFRLANQDSKIVSFVSQSSSGFLSALKKKKHDLPPHSSHPDFGHLTLLVFEAVLEVVFVSLPGYIVARQGMFDAEAQKFLANLNVMIFTPCLIFTKLASQLTAEKLIELAVIPFIFVTQILVSYLCSILVSKLFRFKKRPQNFIVAMGVFGNSNSLPISLVLSLSQTISGLHWDNIPGDNDDEVAARGILYLLIFQQLGQLLRWTWGYNVLLRPKEDYEEEEQEEARPLLNSFEDDGLEEGSRSPPEIRTPHSPLANSGHGSEGFKSGEQTPVNRKKYTDSVSSSKGSTSKAPGLLPTPVNGNVKPGRSEDSEDDGAITTFPEIGAGANGEPTESGFLRRVKSRSSRAVRVTSSKFSNWISAKSSKLFHSLPAPMQKGLSMTYRVIARFLRGLWAFMNPPLWAMLVAIVVASIPDLQRLFFAEGTFISNSITRAVSQSGGVAVPLILVVLGANLARNTLPKEEIYEDEKKIEKKLLIAALVSRMLLPTIVMAPILAVVAKYVPVSILDDPIFVIVCFLLTGAPSALQLAQICQLNNVYMGAMSKLLFQSYVVWILPSTLVLVMCALEVVEWAAQS